MNFTGLTKYQIATLATSSFVFDNFSCDAVETFPGGASSGRKIEFGLTGLSGSQPTGLRFSLINSKIYDPEGRLFGCYNSGEIFSISGNVGQTSYSYYLDGELICAVGVKQNYNATGWFVNCYSGASGEATVSINGPTITGALTFPTSFYSGSQWTGAFSHNNSGDVTIRYGELFGPDSSFFSIATGLVSSSGYIVGSGVNWPVTLNHAVSEDRTGTYIVGIKIHTDYGLNSFRLTGIATKSGTQEIYNSFYTNASGNISTTGLGATGTKYWLYDTIATDTGIPITKSILMELYYNSGYTGNNFQYYTGFSGFSSSGSGYTGIPVAYISPIASGFPIQSGSGLTGALGIVTGVQWVYPSGDFGYTGVYYGHTGTGFRVTFSGLLGVGGWQATGIPLFGTYIKSFSGCFDLYTGVPWNSGVQCYENPNSTMISGSTTLTSGETCSFLQVNYINLRDTAPLYFAILSSGLTDTYNGVSVFSGTGLAYRGI